MEIYDDLILAFNFLNARLFDNKLPECIITLQRSDRIKGSYSSSRYVSSVLNGKNKNEISINPNYFGFEDDINVLMTLAHEMCHLYNDVNGEKESNGYHSKKWCDKMKSIGLQPSDTGKEGGNETGYAMSQYVIQDGPFIRAYSEIKENGWKINWFDRNYIRNVRNECDSEFKAEYKKLSGKKFKYSCGCSNIWGKQGLDLLCRKCGKAFIIK